MALGGKLRGSGGSGVSGSSGGSGGAEALQLSPTRPPLLEDSEEDAVVGLCTLNQVDP
jgi:hypothetical protein